MDTTILKQKEVRFQRTGSQHHRNNQMGAIELLFAEGRGLLKICKSTVSSNPAETEVGRDKLRGASCQWRRDTQIGERRHHGRSSPLLKSSSRRQQRSHGSCGPRRTKHCRLELHSHQHRHIEQRRYTELSGHLCYTEHCRPKLHGQRRSRTEQRRSKLQGQRHVHMAPVANTGTRRCLHPSIH